MKITVEHIASGENEVVLRCKELDDEMLAVLAKLRSGLQKLCVWDETRSTSLLTPDEIVYCETASERCFVYTRTAMYQSALPLAELAERYAHAGFLRANKSTVVNLRHIRSLRSCPGSRVEATVITGEKIVFSRHYAPLLRERLEL